LLFTGRHNGRPAFYFLMNGVTGVPRLSGPEALEHSADNSFELLWATAGDFEDLRLHPAEIRPVLGSLLGQEGDGGLGADGRPATRSAIVRPQ
jgi:8-oxo-dGTP diphosphatase